MRVSFAESLRRERYVRFPLSFTELLCNRTFNFVADLLHLQKSRVWAALLKSLKGHDGPLTAVADPLSVDEQTAFVNVLVERHESAPEEAHELLVALSRTKVLGLK